MKPWITILAISAAVFFAVLWMTGSCDRPTTLPSDDTAWRERVAEKEAVIQNKDERIDSLLRLVATLKKDRTSDSSRLTKVATANFNRYKRAVDEVQHLRDSFPQVNTLVLAADSALAAKDSLYLQELNHRYLAEKLYEQTIAEMADRNVKQVEVSNILTTKVTELTDANYKLARRLERKKTGNRILGGVAAGVAAALGIVILTSQ